MVKRKLLSYIILLSLLLTAFLCPWAMGETAEREPLLLGIRGFPMAGEPTEEAEPLHTAPNARLFQKSKRTLTLDAVTFTPGQSVRIVVSFQNESKDAAAFCVTGVALDGLVFPLDADGLTTVEAGESATVTAVTTAVAQTVLRLAGSAAPKKICVEYVVVVQEKTTQGMSDPVPLFSSEGWAAAFSSEEAPLFEQNSLRVYCLAFQPEYGKALLLLEATKGAAWESVSVDAVYDGCRALKSQTFRLEPGMRAACLLSVASDCPWLGRTRTDGVRAYLTFHHSNKQRSPYEIVLGAPSAAAAITDASQAMWTEGGYSTRYLGVDKGYFSDGDALLFEVTNSTAETVYLACANQYVYLDGTIVAMEEYATACYPGSVSRVAMAPTDADALELAAHQKCAMRLSLYAQEGWYLREVKRSPSFTLLLE